MLLNKGSSQTKSINKHLTIHIFDNPRKFYVIKQRKQSNQIHINKQTSHYPHYSITHESFMLLNKGSSQTKSINKHLIIHIFDNPRMFYVIKQMKQSNQINKQTSHYPHIR